MSCCSVCVAVIIVMYQCLRSLSMMFGDYLLLLFVLLVLSVLFAMFDGFCCDLFRVVVYA